MLFVILQPYRCSDLEIRRKRKLFEPFGDPRVMVYKARISDLDHFSCWSLFTPSCKWCLRTKLSIIWMDQVIIENRELIQRPGWILVKWCHGFRDVVGSSCVMEMKRLKVLDSNLTKSPLQAWFFWIFLLSNLVYKSSHNQLTQPPHDPQSRIDLCAEICSFINNEKTVSETTQHRPINFNCFLNVIKCLRAIWPGHHPEPQSE